jgi:ribosomal protein S27AE
MSDYKPATCQYCLADSNKTALGPDKERRCPVCGADYMGEHRDKEFRVLVEAGLVANDD